MKKGHKTALPDRVAILTNVLEKTLTPEKGQTENN
jgi:hypothetical protein